MIARAVVTGGAGFIGSRLVAKLLSRRANVLVLDNLERGQRASVPEDVRVAFVEANVADAHNMASQISEFSPSHVFHLAAKHFIPECEADPDLTLLVNVEGTRHVADAACAAKASVFVFASSAAVYAPSNTPHTENEPPGPIDVYGQSKLAAETVVRTQKPAPRVEIARLFNVYGPNDTNPHVLPEIIKQLAGGARALRLGRTDTVRDYVFVDDAAEGLIRLAENGAGPVGITNIGTGRGYQVDDLVQTAVSTAPGLCDVRIELDEQRLRPVDRPHLVAEISRMVSRTSLAPIELEDGLRATWAAHSPVKRAL